MPKGSRNSLHFLERDNIRVMKSRYVMWIEYVASMGKMITYTTLKLGYMKKDLGGGDIKTNGI